MIAASSQSSDGVWTSSQLTLCCPKQSSQARITRAPTRSLPSSRCFHSLPPYSTGQRIRGYTPTRPGRTSFEPAEITSRCLTSGNNGQIRTTCNSFAMSSFCSTRVYAGRATSGINSLTCVSVSRLSSRATRIQTISRRSRKPSVLVISITLRSYRKSGDSYRTLKTNQMIYIHPSSSLFQHQPPIETLLYYELVMTSKSPWRLNQRAKWVPLGVDWLLDGSFLVTDSCNLNRLTLVWFGLQSFLTTSSQHTWNSCLRETTKCPRRLERHL